MKVTTLLTSNGAALTKTLTRTASGWEKTGYGDAYLFDAIEHEVSSLAELSALLTGLADETTMCLIRGRLKPGAEAFEVRRLIHDDGDTRANFEEQPVSWLLCDFDGLPAPSPNLTPAQRLAYLVSLLPSEFHHADFHYRWSSGAGLDGWETLSCHLYFWLSEPVRCTTLRLRADQQGWPIDLAPLNPVQIHYTAAPLIVGGSDPLDCPRSGFVTRYRRSVTLPAWSPAPPPVFTATTGVGSPSAYLDAKFAEVGGYRGVHGPLRSAIAATVGIYGADTDRRDLEARVAGALARAPGRNYLNARYVKRLIDGALRKFV